MWPSPCTDSISEYIRVYVPAGCDLACLVIPVREASLFHRRHSAEWLGRCGGYVQQLLKSESSLNFVIYIPFLFLSSGHIKSRWSCEWPLIAGNVTAVRVKSGPKTHPDDSKTVTDISSSRLPTGRISPRLKFHQQAVGATKVDLSNDPYFFLFWTFSFCPSEYILPHKQHPIRWKNRSDQVACNGNGLLSNMNQGALMVRQHPQYLQLQVFRTTTHSG